MRPTLTHIALHVRDLDACISFYREFCDMDIVYERSSDGQRIVWLAESGKENEFIFVLIPGGPGRDQPHNEFSHFGCALESRAAVDEVERFSPHRRRFDRRLRAGDRYDGSGYPLSECQGA